MSKSKKVGVALAAGALLLIVLVSSVYMTDWSDYTIYDEPTDPGWFDQGAEDSDELSDDSLNYQVFENYGPALLVLAMLMFGAMIGGICIAREDKEIDEPEYIEEEKKDDSN